MSKKILLAIFCLIVSNSFAFGASVGIKSEVYQDNTIFTYEFNFTENEGYKSFSFEKPRDAMISYFKDSKNNNIKYSIAGDYIIVQSENVAGNSFITEFTSQVVSNTVVENGKYSVYVNFNFPVEELTYEIELKDQFLPITDFFPRGYQVNNEGNYFWTMNDLEGDTLFLIEFENNTDGSIYGSIFGIDTKIFIGILIGIIVLGVSLFIWLLKRKKRDKTSENEKNNESKNKEFDNDLEQKVEIVKELKEDKQHITNNNNNTIENKNKESFDSILEKYLTDNEKEVVKIVNENQGITQYDILNYAPKLTKSNLSKIITKLNGKKILNRIRVGKVNKIYLGEKLEESKKE